VRCGGHIAGLAATSMRVEVTAKPEQEVLVWILTSGATIPRNTMHR
jgi:hypothetical protein